MNLIELSKAKPDQLPLTKGTIYKMRSQKRHLDLFPKICGKVFFNQDVWESMIKKTSEGNRGGR